MKQRTTYLLKAVILKEMDELAENVIKENNTITAGIQLFDSIRRHGEHCSEKYKTVNSALYLTHLEIDELVNECVSITLKKYLEGF